MIRFTQGNLLEAKAEALVNTVNTVGVMGKGIALMFKDRFTENFRLYAQACKDKRVTTGKMFITPVDELDGPKWVVNFPTKQHWRSPSRLEWIIDGLYDLKQFLVQEHIRSIAIPPLGAGNGGLNWEDVRPQIETILGDIDTEVTVYEPTTKYQNVAKRHGVEKLTPARALIAELIRRYWVQGMECSLLEIQKLAWFLEQQIEKAGLPTLDLRFEAHKYGPYADRLRHVMEGLDGSYLHCEKRISDAQPFDVIWFDDDKKDLLHAYLNSEARNYQEVLNRITTLIDGFESPFGLELLATVDWLLEKEQCPPTVASIKTGIKHWKAINTPDAGTRKSRLFDNDAIELALSRLQQPILTTF